MITKRTPNSIEIMKIPLNRAQGQDAHPSQQRKDRSKVVDMSLNVSNQLSDLSFRDEERFASGNQVEFEARDKF